MRKGNLKTHYGIYFYALVPCALNILENCTSMYTWQANLSHNSHIYSSAHQSDRGKFTLTAAMLPAAAGFPRFKASVSDEITQKYIALRSPSPLAGSY